MSEPTSAGRLRIPVKVTGGQVTYALGGVLPLRDATVGEMIVDRTAVSDGAFLKRLLYKYRHLILPAGTQLLVALTIKHDLPATPIEDGLRRHLIHASIAQLRIGSGFFDRFQTADTHFMMVTVGQSAEADPLVQPKGEGVWLCLQGGQATGIVTGKIFVPEDVSEKPLDSLNHAFTILSEKYEPWRKSHTGNIYERVLFQEEDGRWHPLDVWRRFDAFNDFEDPFNTYPSVRQRWDDIKLVLATPPDEPDLVEIK